MEVEMNGPTDVLASFFLSSVQNQDIPAIVNTETDSANEDSVASSPTAYSPTSTVAGDDSNSDSDEKPPFPYFLNEADRIDKLQEWASHQPPAIRPIDTMLTKDGPGSAPWDDEEWDDDMEFEPQFALESPTSLPLLSSFNIELDETPESVQPNTESRSSVVKRSTNSSCNRYNPYTRLLKLKKQGRSGNRSSSSDVFYPCQCGQLSNPDMILKHLRCPPHTIKWMPNEQNKAPCPWEGCDSAYSTMYRLTVHIREKHWNVTYPCRWCEKVFKKTDKLYNHLAVCAAKPKKA